MRKKERRLLGTAEQVEDHPEDVDDVQEDLDGGEDVVLGAQLVLLPSHQHLHVDRQVYHEQKGSQARVDRVQPLKQRKTSAIGTTRVHGTFCSVERKF